MVRRERSLNPLNRHAAPSKARASTEGVSLTVCIIAIRRYCQSVIDHATDSRCRGGLADWGQAAQEVAMTQAPDRKVPAEPANELAALIGPFWSADKVRAELNLDAAALERAAAAGDL